MTVLERRWSQARSVLAAVLTLLAATTAALAPLTPRATTPDRSTLIIGTTQFPYTLHPGIEPMMAKQYILGLSRRPLTVYNADWRLVCLLCEQLPSFENGLAVREAAPDGGDGVAVTFRLVEGATWGDGTPITSSDVVFTWEVGRDPKSPVGPRELFRRIHAIDTPDERTFTLHVDRLTYDYANISGLPLLPAHLEADIFADDPEAYRTRSTYSAEPTNPGLWYGPYLITEVVAGSHIALKRNPRWWGERPAFDRIVVRTIENTPSLEANLLSGAIHMIPGEVGLPLDQAIALELRAADRLQVLYRPSLVYEHVTLNLDNPALADLRVRRALLLAIDRKAIDAQLFAGRQPVAVTFVNPLDRVYAPEVATLPYDPKQAARLLTEAGWADFEAGVRANDRGEPLRLEIMTTAGDRTRELVQQVLQSQWKAVGIDVRIRNQPARVFFGETVTKRAFSAMAMFAWISSPEGVPRTTLHSDSIPTLAKNWTGQNVGGYVNPEMDQLIDDLEVQLDPPVRQNLWRRLQEIYAHDLPVLPLYHRARAHVLPLWLEGVMPTGHQFPTTLAVETWRIAKP